MKKGKKPSRKIIEEIDNQFTDEIAEYKGYIFNIMLGQGVAYQIYKGSELVLTGI